MTPTSPRGVVTRGRQTRAPGAEPTWLPIAGLPGYDVSDAGQIRSRKRGSVRLLATNRDAKGYIRITFSPTEKERVTYRVHRLVAAAFLGPRPPGQVVRHLDGDPSNNHATNLAYGTHCENEADKARHGTDAYTRVTHCKQGHSYEGVRPSPTDRQRRCLPCARIRDAARRERRRAERTSS